MGLRLDLLPGRPELTNDPALWVRVHALWLDTRREAMREQGVDAVVTSDELTEQDTIAVLSEGSRVLGLYAWRVFDLQNAAYSNHAWVRAFPDAVVAGLRSDHGMVMLAGHMTVASRERRSGGGTHPVADMLVVASLRALAASAADVCVVRTRDNRSAHVIAERHGGQRLATATAYGSTSGVYLFTAKGCRR